VLETKARY